MPRGKPKRIRQQGTGSVFFNKKKNRWQATIELGADAEGKRIRKTYTARIPGKVDDAEAEVEAQLAQWQVELLGGTIKPPSRETVKGYLMAWVADKTALRWGERMAMDVPYKLERYVYPVIGNVRMNDLDATHIRKVYAVMARTESQKGGKGGKSGRTLSKQSILHVHRILHSALGKRVAWEAVEVPSVKRRPAHLPEPEVISDLVAEAFSVRHGLVFVLMAMTAARPEEVLGLRRSDLDFERGTITFAEVQITRLPVAQLRFKETKTEQSHRTMEVPEEVMAALRAYCDERAELQLRAGRVFTTDEGAPLPIWRLYTVWKALLRRKDVPYFRPYDLRHFTASFWLDEGLPLAIVSAALGHSTQRTTAGVYSHKLRRSESKIATTSGKLLRLGKKEEKGEQA